MPRRAARTIRLASALLLLLAASGCHSGSAAGGDAGRSGRFDSRAIEDRRERLELVRRYVTPVTPPEDAAFLIDYRDGGGLVPGPSEWDLRIAFRVDRERVQAWTAAYARELGPPADGLDPGLAPVLAMAENGGFPEPAGPARSFGKGTRLRAVFEREGLVLVLDASHAP